MYSQLPTLDSQLSTLNSLVGIGLRHKHFPHFLHDDPKPDVPWLEVHTENFFSTGAAASNILAEIRKNYPLSAHCVGLSLGSSEPVSETHLNGVLSFIERYDPFLVSDHLSWSSAQGQFLPDLLPLPYTEEALSALVRNIQKTQEYLGRQILLENPSSYLTFTASHIPEAEFLAEAARRSGCGILLDLNNVHVTKHNNGVDADAYLACIPRDAVQEMHLAGFAESEVSGEIVYIDDHGAPVYDDVWRLYEKALQRFGSVPTLIEWDTNVPELSVLLAEKEKAEKINMNIAQNTQAAHRSAKAVA